MNQQVLMGKRAVAFRNEDLIAIYSESGRGLLTMDPVGASWILPIDASTEKLGMALRDALEKSRFLSQEEAGVLLRREATKRTYDEWVQAVLRFRSPKSRRSLFRNMTSCNVKLADSQIRLEPTRHVKQEAWEGLGQETAVMVYSSEPDSRLGEALRQAFDLCQ